MNYITLFLIEYTMKKSLYTFLILVGTVIGSGFLSGKEIVVFFSRFGLLSYPCIVLATILFAALFFFLLSAGEKAVKRLQKSKYSNLINIVICTILSSAMFAGCFNVLNKLGSFIAYPFLLIIGFACFIINRKGLGYLEKANLIIVPIMVFMLIANVASQAKLGTETHVYSYLGIYYAVMYVILNTASSSVLLANLGESLSKKQKAQVSILSALVLGAILLLANFVLLQNPSNFNEEMPLISLFSGLQGALMQLVILFGCLTTLFSAVFTLGQSLRGLIGVKSANVASILAPLILSFLGFGNIVSMLYPLSSVLGIFLLFDLFLVPFFKQTYKTIHSARNNTK